MSVIALSRFDAFLTLFGVIDNVLELNSTPRLMLSCGSFLKCN